MKLISRAQTLEDIYSVGIKGRDSDLDLTVCLLLKEYVPIFSVRESTGFGTLRDITILTCASWCGCLPLQAMLVPTPALTSDLGYPLSCACGAAWSWISTHLLLRRRLVLNIHSPPLHLCLVLDIYSTSTAPLHGLDIHSPAPVPLPRFEYSLTCSCTSAWS
ncbi:hypothetical protein PoB_003904700 [Plakobranchus ocellatus]|uniref:Uncharacterized protein n=1 Tax=Plakobranchus ocellatus TaxID=259542 RepID=A0AAV4B073_9GAST|nr:hypothetical protein PoB_003904700 [Plakobranchus ocellatus]